SGGICFLGSSSRRSSITINRIPPSTPARTEATPDPARCVRKFAPKKHHGVCFVSTGRAFHAPPASGSTPRAIYLCVSSGIFRDLFLEFLLRLLESRALRFVFTRSVASQQKNDYYHLRKIVLISPARRDGSLLPGQGLLLVVHSGQRENDGRAQGDH